MAKKEKPLVITKEELLRIARQIRREEFVEEGAYDGRLRPKVIPDKRKEEARRKCREKIRWE